MPNIVDKYTRPKAPLLADDVATVVERNRVWLEVARPTTAKRNANYREAFRSIWRTACDPQIEGYVLRTQGKMVRGLATITMSQTVYHAAIGGEITGNQVDLWFDADVPPEDQRPVVHTLVRIAGRHGANVFGALTAMEQERAGGLGLILPEIGLPGMLLTPYGDPFGITASGEPLQLYANRRESSI